MKWNILFDLVCPNGSYARDGDSQTGERYNFSQTKNNFFYLFSCAQ